jgi:hypothetical protein
LRLPNERPAASSTRSFRCAIGWIRSIVPAHGIDRSVVRPPQRHRDRDLTALFAKVGVPLQPKLHAVATAPPG